MLSCTESVYEFSNYCWPSGLASLSPFSEMRKVVWYSHQFNMFIFLNWVLLFFYHGKVPFHFHIIELCIIFYLRKKCSFLFSYFFKKVFYWFFFTYSRIKSNKDSTITTLFLFLKTCLCVCFFDTFLLRNAS